ncbi:MAG: serine/threonine protein kinase [Polyangiaceae bacterium]|nr:serine/threonine protein kinase [Polyangiaceae bacterium]
MGALLTPELRLVAPLGEGGMGCVWLADHAVLDRRVAVKFLRDHIAHEPSARERLRREAAAVSRLKSPHIVEVLEQGDGDGDVPYIVMELLSGETLQDRVEYTGPMSFEEAKRVVRQALSGLARAHDAGIVHRDIKPDNVFLALGELPLVKLLDFGIARDLDRTVSRMTTTGNVVGTPLFMAPEQMAGIAVLPASDVWAFAIVVYYCVTGTLPYAGETLAALALAIDRERPTPPSAHAQGLPANFDAWLGRALAPRFEDRYADAAEMLEAFEQYVAPADAPAMRPFAGGALWAQTTTAVAEQPERGRFPVPLKAGSGETDSSRDRETARFRITRRRQIGLPLLTAAAGAIVASLGVVGVYSSRSAEATPRYIDGTTTAQQAAPAPSAASRESDAHATGTAASNMRSPVCAAGLPLATNDASDQLLDALPMTRTRLRPDSTASTTHASMPSAQRASRKPQRRNLGF